MKPSNLAIVTAVGGFGWACCQIIFEMPLFGQLWIAALGWGLFLLLDAEVQRWLKLFKELDSKYDDLAKQVVEMDSPEHAEMVLHYHNYVVIPPNDVPEEA